MPAKSARQQRYMAMCAHSNKPGCPPKKVAHEFSHKPKGGYRRKKSGVGLRTGKFY